MPGRLVLVIVASAMVRIAGGASGVLVGLYLAELAHDRAAIDAALVAVLSADSFGAELAAGVPMGILSDLVAPRFVMTAAALVAAVAALIFGSTHDGGCFLSVGFTRVWQQPR